MDLDETVLSIQQRQKRAQIIRRNKSKIERAREVAKKRMAPASSIRKRAFAQARQLIRRRVAGQRGAEYEKLGPSEKIAIDRAVEGKQKLIKKLALRLIPRVKQAESKRLHSFMQGQQMQNLGQPEGKSTESSGSSSVKESLNYLFTEAFPPADTSSAVGQRADSPVVSSNKKMPPKGKSKNTEVIQYNKFNEEVEFDTPTFASLFKKSEKSGIDLEILGEVYNRGWNIWTENCKVSQQQYAFARVNSFINQGKTYFNEDADLHEARAPGRAYVAPFHDEQGNQKGWKSSNKWGKVKYWQSTAKKSALKHAGLQEEEVQIDESEDRIQKIMHKGEHVANIRTYRGRAGGWMSQVEHPNGSDASKKYGITHNDTKKEMVRMIKKYHAGTTQTNENFIDGKGPGKSGDAARHGLKGKSAAELKKIRSSETASPRIKQLAHWMLNMHHNEETELGENGLWDNIHAKRKRIKAGSGERMRKPGSEGAPTKQDFKDASKSVQEGYDVNNKHYKALTDLDLNTKNRDMTIQKDGYGPINPNDIKGSKPFWDDKAKMWKTTTEAAMAARCGNCAAFNQSKDVLDRIAQGLGPAGKKIEELANIGFCELFEFKCAGDRTCNKWLMNGPITEEDTGNGTRVVDKESANSKTRKKIDVVDRKVPYQGITRQSELQKKVIDEFVFNDQELDFFLEHGVEFAELLDEAANPTKRQTKKLISRWHDKEQGQMYGDQPYSYHPKKVMNIGKKVFGTRRFGPATKKVALLHDTLEDTPHTPEDLKARGFTPEVIDAVKLLSKDKKLSYRDNIERIANSGNRHAQMVKYADNMANFTGDKSGWDPEKRKASQAKYMDSMRRLGAVLGVKHHEELEESDKPSSRLIGTNSLVKTYKKDTPGQNLDEAFNIAFAAGVGVTLTAADLGMRAQGGFALHPSVIDQMDEMEEEVRSSDVKGVVVHTASGKTVVRKQKVNRKIVGTGNLTDGKPNDTL